jgi:hypothetical protein
MAALQMTPVPPADNAKRLGARRGLKVRSNSCSCLVAQRVRVSQEEGAPRSGVLGRLLKLPQILEVELRSQLG